MPKPEPKPAPKPDNQKLTFIAAKEEVKSMGGKLKKTDFGDFRLRIHGEEYYSDSLQDIVGTARVINRRAIIDAAIKTVTQYPWK